MLQATTQSLLCKKMKKKNKNWSNIGSLFSTQEGYFDNLPGEVTYVRNENRLQSKNVDAPQAFQSPSIHRLPKISTHPPIRRAKIPRENPPGTTKSLPPSASSEEAKKPRETIIPHAALFKGEEKQLAARPFAHTLALSTAHARPGPPLQEKPRGEDL